MPLSPAQRKRILKALDSFEIEVPSWGFADTGTRFGKFPQPAAASTLEEKLEDAGTCHTLTGCCPTVAVHVLWDFDQAANSKDQTGWQRRAPSSDVPSIARGRTLRRRVRAAPCPA